jgi:hypothetical protein
MGHCSATGSSQTWSHPRFRSLWRRLGQQAKQEKVFELRRRCEAVKKSAMAQKKSAMAQKKSAMAQKKSAMA